MLTAERREREPEPEFVFGPDTALGKFREYMDRFNAEMAGLFRLPPEMMKAPDPEPAPASPLSAEREAEIRRLHEPYSEARAGYCDPCWLIRALDASRAEVAREREWSAQLNKDTQRHCAEKIVERNRADAAEARLAEVDQWARGKGDQPLADILEWAERREREPRVMAEIDGTWPPDCVQRAFVEGAAWWEYTKTGGTMWQSDQRVAEQAAVARYGELPPEPAPEPAPEPRAELAQEREAGAKVRLHAAALEWQCERRRHDAPYEPSRRPPRRAPRAAGRGGPC